MDDNNELKQAEHDRDIALIGDAVHLLAQGAAMHGGAWKIGKPTNFTEQANKRILEIKKRQRQEQQRLREQMLKLHATNIANAQKQQQFETKQEQQQKQFDTRMKQQQQQFDRKLEQQQQQFDTRMEQQFGTKQQQKQQTKNKTAYDTYEIYQPENGTYKAYPNVHAAYYALPQGYKAVKIYLDNTGKQLIVEDPHPTVQKMQQMINIYNFTKENGIEYDGFDTQPFNIEEGYSGYENKDLQTPTYNPDGSISFKKVSDQPPRRRR